VIQINVTNVTLQNVKREILHIYYKYFQVTQVSPLIIKDIRKKNNWTQEDLAKKLGVTRKTIISYEQGVAIPEPKMDLLKQVLGETGKPENQQIKTNKGIAYYEDVDVTAGPIDLFTDGSLEPTAYMLIPHFEDCDRAFPLWGDSMSPVYQSGQIVLCKEYSQWQDYVPYGEVFLVITDVLRTVKYVKKASSEDKYLLVSENPHFDSFEVPKQHIRRMFIVKGAIKRNMI